MVIYWAVCKGESMCLFLGLSYRSSLFVSSGERCWDVSLCAWLLIMFITRLSAWDSFPFTSRRYTAPFFMDGDTSFSVYERVRLGSKVHMTSLHCSRSQRGNVKSGRGVLGKGIKRTLWGWIPQAGNRERTLLVFLEMSLCFKIFRLVSDKMH